MSSYALPMARILRNHFIRLDEAIGETFPIEKFSMEKLNTLSNLAKAYSALTQPGILLKKEFDGDQSYQFGLMLDD